MTDCFFCRKPNAGYILLPHPLEPKQTCMCCQACAFVTCYAYLLVGMVGVNPVEAHAMAMVYVTHTPEEIEQAKLAAKAKTELSQVKKEIADAQSPADLFKKKD